MKAVHMHPWVIITRHSGSEEEGGTHEHGQRQSACQLARIAQHCLGLGIRRAWKERDSKEKMELNWSMHL